MRRSVRGRLDDLVSWTRRGSESFWSLVRRWFLVAAIVGLLVGIIVTAFDTLTALVFGETVAQAGMLGTLIFPTIALMFSGLLLQYATVNPEIHGTEEVIEAFHRRNGVFRFRSFPGKVAAAFSTLSLGGSAGTEGPSIYIGGAIGSFLLRKLRRTGFSDEDVRTLMIAGAAAGVSAVFKAPLTGIIFALEVPYRDDLTREALIPSMVASVTAYLVLVQFLGVTPLFDVGERVVSSGLDLAYSAGLGVLVGLSARIFVGVFRRLKDRIAEIPVPLWVRTTGGGLATGLFGVAALALFDAPLVLGTGYEIVPEVTSGQFTSLEALELFVLKAGAVTATLASGAAGGIFIPLILLGASLGGVFRGLLPNSAGPLLPVVGMAAFLAAGYNAPLAATVFIAESTGGAGYLIPGLVAAAVAYAVAGRTSVSDQQQWRRQTQIDRMLAVKVGDIMTRDVVTVSREDTVEEFVTQHLLRHRHKSLPVVSGEQTLVGMVGIVDVRAVDRELWPATSIGDVMTTDLLTARRATVVGDIAPLMAERDIDRVPVVAEEDPTRLVGIVSTTDILEIEEILEGREERAENARSTS